MKIFFISGLLISVLFIYEIKGQEVFITTSDGVDLYASIKGEGIPCLFIHGGPGQGSNYWEELAGKVGEKHFKMIYLDQRGCGRSASPADSDYTIDRMVLDFEEVRQQLNIGEWMIMGHSFGGVLQTYYAKQHPDKIKGILMFNCTLNMKKSVEKSYLPSVVEFFNIKDTTYLLNLEIPLSERLDSIQRLFTTSQDVWKLSFSSVESAVKFGQTYAGFESWNMDFSKAAFGIRDYRKDYTPLTSEIQIPTLFLYGTNDKNVGVNHYKEMKFPQMMLIKMDGGHMDFIDRNEEYLKAVDIFFEEYF